jgi:hypothetical protein
MEENPWGGINLDNPDGNYVLNDDKQLIDTNNDILGNDQSDDGFIDLSYFPEPFIGNKNARIYFLLANPGRASNDDPAAQLNVEQKKILRNSIQRNLEHQSKEMDYPFYILNPAFTGTSGYNWWKRCLDPLISSLEIDDQIIGNNFFNVELYGYHSFRINNYLLRNNKLSSLKYTRALVDKAIDDQKLVLIGRSVRNWFYLVPRLSNYQNCFFVANERKMILSEMTLSPPIIQKIVEILSHE